MKSDEIIYLDYAAATPLDERVFEAMKPYFSEVFYNPSAAYQPAREVKQTIEEVRSKVAHIIGAKPGEIVFTAGATESINLAFKGVLDNDTHVVTTAIEHQAILGSIKGYSSSIVPVNRKGLIDLKDLERLVQPQTKLISVGLVNNELGIIQPLRLVSQLVQRIRHKRFEEGNETPIYLHTDASQAAGLLDLHVARLGVDLMTLGGGKIYGPKQSGILFVQSSVGLLPTMTGGGQERGLRSGTESVVNIIGFAEALSLADKKKKTEVKRLQDLRAHFITLLTESFSDDIVIITDQKQSAAHILSIAWPGVDAERVLYALESKGVLVATGSACAANKGTRSHVLEAIGLEAETIDGSLRLSFGRESNEERIAQAVKIITEVVKKEQTR